jgi:hypothetical protein
MERWVAQLGTDVDGDGVVDEDKGGSSGAAELEEVFKTGTNLIKVVSGCVV